VQSDPQGYLLNVGQPSASFSLVSSGGLSASRTSPDRGRLRRVCFIVQQKVSEHPVTPERLCEDPHRRRSFLFRGIMPGGKPCLLLRPEQNVNSRRTRRAPPAGTRGEEGLSRLCGWGPPSPASPASLKADGFTFLTGSPPPFGVDENARKVSPKREVAQYRIFICNYCTLVANDFENENKVCVNYKV